jgi:hypothetical protein
MADKTAENPGVQVNINLDTTPILYTDDIFMSTNADGVVLDVTQRLGSTNQLRIVARIGMSRDHAKKFVDKLEKLLQITEGKSQSGEKIN